MPTPGFEIDGYSRWKRKLADALQESKVAAANTMAHSLESTAGLIKILDHIEAAQAQLALEPADA
jgi:hypothetical protein